jgi:chemotaxis protein methyltransferase CheR
MYRPSDLDVEMSEEEFRLLRDLIHEKFGLFFDDNQRASLRARLQGRLASRGLHSFEDYFHELRFAPDRADELVSMVTHLTNNETYFYREGPQLNVFADHVLRQTKERKTRLRSGASSMSEEGLGPDERKSRSGDRRLRLLSAGCSTGEEAYTLAMIVFDSGQFFWNWEVEVVGLDVDQSALDKAQRGVYQHNSFRALPADVKARHFVPAGPNTFQVKEPIRRMVSWRRGNLVEPESFEGLAPLDVIFCRNVLIYFSDAMILRVVRILRNILAPGGYLCLGHAESLSRITDLFLPVRFQGAMVYQAAGAGAWTEGDA